MSRTLQPNYNWCNSCSLSNKILSLLFSRLLIILRQYCLKCPGVSGLKKERKFRLAENKSRSHKIINKVTKRTRKLQSDLISDIDWSTGNEYFT